MESAFFVVKSLSIEPLSCGLEVCFRQNEELREMNHTDKLGISKYFSMEYRVVFFWTFAGYVYFERPEPTLSWYVWQFSMKLPQGKNRGDMAKSKLKADEKNLTQT